MPDRTVTAHHEVRHHWAVFRKVARKEKLMRVGARNRKVKTDVWGIWKAVTVPGAHKPRQYPISQSIRLEESQLRTLNSIDTDERVFALRG